MATTASLSLTTARAEEISGRALDLVHRWQHDEALTLITKAVEQHHGPLPPKIALAQAKALIGLERNRAAEEIVGPLVGRDDLTPQERALARQLLGRILVRTWGDLDVAIDYLREAAKAAERFGHDGREIVSFARGDAAVGLGRKRARQAAWRELSRAKEIVGEDARMLAFEAGVLLDFDERTTARDLYARCASLPGDGPRFHNLGFAFVARLDGKFADAHARLDALAPLGKCDLGPRHERARLLVSEKRWNDAVKAFDDLLSASPLADSARWSRSERASALLHGNRRDEAIQAYEQIASEPVEDRYATAARRVLKYLKDPARRSAKRARLREFPSVAQLRDHCGPASCELYLRYHGIPADQVEIARQIKLPNAGTPVYAMRTFLEGAGLEVRRIEATLPVMKAVIDIGLPLILEEEYSTSRHVAVAIGYDDEREILEVQDPMTHEIRETPYEALPRLLAMANHGAIIGFPKGDDARRKALDAANVIDMEYIRLIDDAWRAFDAKSLDEAEKLCEQSLALRKDYEFTWICKHQIVRERHWQNPHPNLQKQLEEILSQMLVLWPDDEWPQQYVGYTRYNAHDYESALAAFEKARDRDDADGNNWAMIADCQIALGRRDAAMRSLYETLRRVPSHVRASENLSDLLEGRGDLGRAAVLNDVAQELNPKNPFNYEVAARLAERVGKNQQALELFTKATEVDPNRGFARFQRARLLAVLGRMNDAMAILQPQLDASPKDVRIRVDVADILYLNGAPDRAIKLCDEILTLEPNNASGQAIKGAALASSGQLDEGIKTMRKALALRPSYAWVYAETGKQLQKAGRHAEAVEAFAAANGINPNANNRFALGSALAAAGFGKDAVWHLRESSRIGAIDEEKLVRVAEVLTKEESVRSAVDLLEEVAKSRRGEPGPTRALVRLLLETSYYPRAAEKHLDRLVELSPDDPWAMMRRGTQAMDAALEREVEGEHLLRRAVEQLGKARAPRLTLAHELNERGRYAEAMALLEGDPPLLAVQKERVAALLGLDRAQDAFKLASDQEIESPRRADSWELKYMIAKHVEEWKPALEFVEKLSHESGEHEDDGQLDYWECEKFKCLLRLGEIDRAVSFGDKQAGSAADAAYLGYLAVAVDDIVVAKRFVDKALAMDPDQKLALTEHARLLELAGDASGAERTWRRVMELDAEDHSSRENVARLLLGRGDVERARPLADEAVRLGHMCPWAMAMRGRVRAMAGDRTNATADFERAWALASPTDRKKGVEGTWAVRAALRGEAAEARRLRDVALAAKTPHSEADDAALQKTLAALGV